MKSGIYKIYFKTTPDKVYVGSSKDISRRWKQHIKKLKDLKHINRRLQNAFNKCTELDIAFELIEKCSIDVLIVREQYYYNEFQSKGLILYNAAYPDVYPTNSGETHIKKGSNPWNKGKTGIYSDETLEAMSLDKKGKASWNKGKKMTTPSKSIGRKASDETKQKLSESHKDQIPWFKKIGVNPPANTGKTRFKKGNNPAWKTDQTPEGIEKRRLAVLKMKETKKKNPKIWTDEERKVQSEKMKEIRRIKKLQQLKEAS